MRLSPAILLAFLVGAASYPGAQAPPKVAPPAQKPPVAESQATPVTPEQVKAAIDRLGDLDFPIRSSAARTVRRADPTVAVPALLAAVKQHSDQYVRFRALVLLSGFNDPRTREVMFAAASDKNDRMRTVAYSYFERNPDKTVIPRLQEALNVEASEFVRPALTRALADVLSRSDELDEYREHADEHLARHGTEKIAAEYLKVFARALG